MTNEHLQYEAILAIQEARRTVKLALVRALSFEQLLQRFAAILTDDSPSEVIYALGERPLDAAMAAALTSAIQAHMDNAKSASGKTRSQIDRYIALLIPDLPDDLKLPLLSEYLEDKRVTRRNVGFRALKRCEISPKLAGYLRDQFFCQW